MKKTVFLILALMICLSLCACGGGISTKSESLAGTYTNVSFSPDTKYTLNENSTYDKVSPNEKGTYKASKGGFVLTDTNDDETVFAKEGDYYYRTNLICCFEKYEDYGLAPTFSKDGKSNQWFCAYYETISNSRWKVIILTLNEDGTFKLRDCERDNAGHQNDGTVYEGEYTLDGSILNLTHDGGTIPFLYVNEKIYFDVIQKTA